MISFVDFLLRNVYRSRPIDSGHILAAYKATLADVQYHFPKITEAVLQSRIENNNNELALFLFRLGEELHKAEDESGMSEIHGLMKAMCGCEIYFNNKIGTGFYIVHGSGTVVGSRNSIGNGFKIHQGCTIGHKKNNAGNGNIIGNDVTMYCNSSIIGEVNVGDDAVIGAHVMITKDIPAGHIVTNTNEYQIKKLG